MCSRLQLRSSARFQLLTTVTLGAAALPAQQDAKPFKCLLSEG